MQNNLKLLALTLFIVVSALRCSSSKDIEEVGGKNNRAGDVSFYADNTDISIKETDEKGSFAFKTEKTLEKDVVIILSVKDKGVSLPVDKITLLAGATTAEGEVVFSKEMFEGVDDNLIEVTLTASSEDVSLDNVAVTYDVRKYIYGAPDVTITVDTANVEVFYENVPVKVTVQSNIPMPADATFALSIDGATEGVDCNFPDKNVTIKKGEKEGSVVLTLLKSSFIDGNPDKESGKPGDKAMDIGIKMKTTAAVNMAKSTVIVNAIGGFFTTTYCKPYMVSLASHYMHSFTIGDYTLDPPHLATEKHHYADLRNSLENPIGRIEVPTGTSPLSFVTESRPNYGTANNIAVAWIDWNKDGDFLDEGEFVANIPYTASEANNGAVYTVDLTTPSFVKPGMSTVMRIGVIDKQGDTMTKSGGCGGSSQGDVVDVRIYMVSGVASVTYTGNLSNENITVRGTDVVKTITANIDQSAVADVDIKVSVTGVDENNYVLKDKVIRILKGTKSASTTLTIKESAYRIALQKDTYKIELVPGSKYQSGAGAGTKATYNVQGEGTAPTLSVETTQTGDVIVSEGTDVTVAFKVNISEQSSKEVNVQLNLDAKYADMVKLSTNTVRFAAGSATSQNVNITFKASYFMFNDIRETIPVSISTNTEGIFVNTLKSKVSFSVKGAANRPMLITMSDNVENPANRILDVTSDEQMATCALWFNAPTGSLLDKTIKMDVSLEKSGFSGDVYIRHQDMNDYVLYTGPLTITMEAGVNNSTKRYYIKVPQTSVSQGTTNGVINVKVQTVSGNVKFYNGGKNNIEYQLQVIRN